MWNQAVWFKWFLVHTNVQVHMHWLDNKFYFKQQLRVGSTPTLCSIALPLCDTLWFFSAGLDQIKAILYMFCILCAPWASWILCGHCLISSLSDYQMSIQKLLQWSKELQTYSKLMHYHSTQQVLAKRCCHCWASCGFCWLWLDYICGLFFQIFRKNLFFLRTPQESCRAPNGRGASDAPLLTNRSDRGPLVPAATNKWTASEQQETSSAARMAQSMSGTWKSTRSCSCNIPATQRPKTIVYLQQKHFGGMWDGI